MLSKILHAGEGPLVEPFHWPAAGATASPARVRAHPDSAGRGDEGSTERRIAELEEQLAGQASEARQAGYREGEAAARSQAAAEVQPVLEKLTRSIAEIAGLRGGLAREAEAELVELSLGIARRILRRELAVDPAALQGLVKVALEKLLSQEIHRIRTHPDLEPAVRNALEHAGRSGLQVVPDNTLERGAILLETSRGKLDASLESQLAEIGRGLADRLPERGHAGSS